MTNAVVVGSGPNGLVAAITLAAAGHSVTVLEAADEIGGGTRSAELTLPGYVHDVCSAIHALGVVSPAFRALPLAEHGLRWVTPEVALAHPLDGARAAVVYSSVARTAESLGADSRRYQQLFDPLVAHADALVPALLAPIVRVPRHPIALARFGLPALLPASLLAKRWFRTDEARALFAGNAAHSILPLSQPLTSSFGLLLLLTAHLGGWPVAAGGSQSIANSLASVLRSLGGTIECGRPVRSEHDIPASAKVVLFDTVPGTMVSVVGDSLPERYRHRLSRFRHGPGAFKIDYALSEPVPWTHPSCRVAGTVHVGGGIDEIAVSERMVAKDQHSERPFVLCAQQAVVDPSRVPDGGHQLWAYCHVPAGSTVDMTAAIESQIERFAPGFRDTIVQRRVLDPAWFAEHNQNYPGGDIAGGSLAMGQAVFRPTISLHPYRTPNPRYYLCSASTPPGAGVHGMCGWHAAQDALHAGVL
jgi:phytoene dehydrogenase-like protein